jgi:2-polyprenyl-3-methyl-5-hydroxy-6-metoxy-1,4-benzoquinol methylase
MGELIQRERAERPADFSGERLTSAMSGQVEIEHYHRYLLARDFCAGRDVLDIASGEGYGTALLAQVARSATGVEIDAAVVAAAQAEFGRSNLRYLQGDAVAVPVDDATFDIVVSFETLEHLPDQDRFLSELTRVLRPGGMLMISTPDRDVYSPVGTVPNPFHVHELTRAEFMAALGRHFAHVVLATQRPIIGSAIVADGANSVPRVFERRGERHIEANHGLPRAPYMIAVASNAAAPELPFSLYIQRSDIDTDWEARLAAERRALSLSGELEAARTDTVNLEGQLERQGAECARLQGIVIQLQADAARLQQETEAATARALQAETAAETARQQLHIFERSTAWRSTAPLRSIGARHPGLARLLRGIARTFGIGSRGGS